MRCPKCEHWPSEVAKTTNRAGCDSVVRTRACPACGHKWKTAETAVAAEPAARKPRPAPAEKRRRAEEPRSAPRRDPLRRGGRENFGDYQPFGERFDDFLPEC